MVLEVRILHYFLKVFSFLLLIILVINIFFWSSLTIKKNIKTTNFYIEKGSPIQKIIKDTFVKTNIIEIYAFKFYYFFNSRYFNNYIHYGEFFLNEKISLINFYKVISSPSNVINKITIIDGSNKGNLNIELSKIFDDYENIEYNSILADTYYFNKNEKFNVFLNKLINFKEEYISKNLKNEFFDNFSVNDLFIIGSLIDKEGLDYNDKKLISSVIINRLNKNMRLQIDASVIYALTDGNYNLNRELKIKDLKYDHPYNTYVIQGLPPSPISYVGTRTIDIILENHKSEYMFYFFNKHINKHIFSKTYDEHKLKLNEYRNQK